MAIFGAHSALGAADVEEGGETSFTDSAWLDEAVQLKGSPSECARNKVFTRPRKGDALLFFDLQPVSHGLQWLPGNIAPSCASGIAIECA